jgi:membrane-associated phospholipid phosphatase
MVLALLAALAWRRPWIFPLVSAGAFLADLIALGIKVITNRSRPYVDHPDPEPLLGVALDLSFPSGHAASAFAGATLLAGLAPRFAAPLFALAVAMAWSRVYVGVHYPLDVLAGAILGAAVGLGLLFAARALRLPAEVRPRSRRAPPPG